MLKENFLKGFGAGLAILSLSINNLWSQAQCFRLDNISQQAMAELCNFDDSLARCQKCKSIKATPAVSDKPAAKQSNLSSDSLDRDSKSLHEEFRYISDNLQRRGDEIQKYCDDVNYLQVNLEKFASDLKSDNPLVSAPVKANLVGVYRSIIPFNFDASGLKGLEFPNGSALNGFDRREAGLIPRFSESILHSAKRHCGNYGIGFNRRRYKNFCESELVTLRKSVDKLYPIVNQLREQHHACGDRASVLFEILFKP